MELVCPFCKSTLKHETNTELSCQRCSKKFKIRNGIYDFTDENWSWLEDSAETRKLVETISKQGFAKAKKSLGTKYKYIFSENRADWLFHCINPKNNERCLDIGSGFGTISFLLSRWYNEVWSLEKAAERIELQRLRKNEEGKNVFLTRSDMLNLPFPNRSFDLVCLNGVLEWAGVSKPNQNPSKTQLELLSETKRVLKDTGCLYIGIENRFGLQYLLGAKDHDGLPFTSILPRFVSNFLVRIFKKGRYLTYTYSYLEYRKLLKEAEFNYIKLYWVMPGYHYPIYSGKIDDVDSFKLCLKLTRKRTNSFFKKMIFSLMIMAPEPLVRFILRFFCPEYLIFAFKKREDTLECAILGDVGAENFLRQSGDHGIINYFAFNEEGEVAYLVKVPRLKGDSERFNDNGKVIKKPVKRKEILGIEIFVEEITNRNLPKP